MRVSVKFATQVVANSLIFGGVLLLSLTLWPVVSSEFSYWWGTQGWGKGTIGESATPGSLFGGLASAPSPLRVEPKSQDFGLVIEKIGVNAPVVEDVSVTDPQVYTEALRHGVAHARGTATPGEVGNIYLFAHSSLNFWQLGEYATVFNLLRKLEGGDRVVLFYEGERFDFIVESKNIVSRFDLAPLLAETKRQLLTLQTCHPPGTTLNRLVVTASRQGGK